MRTNNPREFGLEWRAQARGLVDESTKQLRKRVCERQSRSVLLAQLERAPLGGPELPFERAPLLEHVLQTRKLELVHVKGRD